MTFLPTALSLSNSFTKVGAIAAFVAILGIAVLSLLVFSQAREIKRLREWAGRAPERAAENEQRVAAAAALRVQQQQQPATGVQAVRPIQPAGVPPGQQPGRRLPRRPAASPAGDQPAGGGHSLRALPSPASRVSGVAPVPPAGVPRPVTAATARRRCRRPPWAPQPRHAGAAHRRAPEPCLSSSPAPTGRQPPGSRPSSRARPPLRPPGRRRAGRLRGTATPTPEAGTRRPAHPRGAPVCGSRLGGRDGAGLTHRGNAPPQPPAAGAARRTGDSAAEIRAGALAARSPAPATAAAVAGGSAAPPRAPGLPLRPVNTPGPPTSGATTAAASAAAAGAAAAERGPRGETAPGAQPPGERRFPPAPPAGQEPRRSPTATRLPSWPR